MSERAQSDIRHRLMPTKRDDNVGMLWEVRRIGHITIIVSYLTVLHCANLEKRCVGALLVT